NGTINQANGGGNIKRKSHGGQPFDKGGDSQQNFAGQAGGGGNTNVLTRRRPPRRPKWSHPGRGPPPCLRPQQLAAWRGAGPRHVEIANVRAPAPIGHGAFGSKCSMGGSIAGSSRPFHETMARGPPAAAAWRWPDGRTLLPSKARGWSPGWRACLKELEKKC